MPLVLLGKILVGSGTTLLVLKIIADLITLAR